MSPVSFTVARFGAQPCAVTHRQGFLGLFGALYIVPSAHSNATRCPTCQEQLWPTPFCACRGKVAEAFRALGAFCAPVSLDPPRAIGEAPPAQPGSFARRNVSGCSPLSDVCTRCGRNLGTNNTLYSNLGEMIGAVPRLQPRRACDMWHVICDMCHALVAFHAEQCF